jgi:GNAT superfamily N-acetyltransferase
VKPSAQGQGVGTALLQHVINIVDTENPTNPTPIYLDASKAGQPVYLKAGYEYFGDKERDYPAMVRWGRGRAERGKE